MQNVLGISFSTRIIGFADFEDGRLADWKIHSFFNAWSDKKLKSILRVIADTAEQNQAKAIAIKLPDTLPVSKSFMQIIGSINAYFESKQLPVYYFMLSEIKINLCRDVSINKRSLMDCILNRYPDLAVEYKKECANNVPYYDKIFEAIGAGYSLIKST